LNEEYSVAFIFLIIAIAYIWWYERKNRKRQQLIFIKEYKFLDAIVGRFKKSYPSFKEDEIELVTKALKDYFYICNMANGKMVSMPSKVVDDLWHQFLLFSIEYNNFCKEAFGRYLHHSPTEVMPNRAMSQSKGLKTAWILACEKDAIDPKYPTKLPLLFAIDEMLNIKDGNRYSLRKNGFKNANSSSSSCSSCGDGYYVGNFTDTSSSGGGSWGDSGCGNGCGGGCGGD